MIKKINFANPVHQFFIVLMTNLVLFIFLYADPISNHQLHPPKEEYAKNFFFLSDAMSYINPAKNFLRFGTFGNGDTPEYVRTVGYPAYLSGLIYFFGENFFWIAYLIQGILSALIFSIVTAISNIFTKNNHRISKTVFILLWSSGAYWLYFPQIMTDMFFSFFLIAGIYYGIRAISEKSWKLIIIHLLFIGYAANIRPTLGFYVIPEFFMLLFLAVHFKTIPDKKTKAIIYSTSVLLFMLTNMPSLRNYINYQIITPSPVLAHNLYDNFARDVMTFAHKENDYIRDSKIAYNQDNINWANAAYFRKKATLAIIKSYPLETTIVFVKHGIINFLYPHLRNIFNTTLQKDLFFESSLEITDTHSILQRLKKFGPLMFFACVFFTSLYLLLFLLVTKHVFRKFKEKHILYLFAILTFLGCLFVPSIITGGGYLRFRLPIDWLIVLLATIEFYHMWDIYKSKSKLPPIPQRSTVGMK